MKYIFFILFLASSICNAQVHTGHTLSRGLPAGTLVLNSSGSGEIIVDTTSSGGSGTVSNVGLTMPSIFTVSGSPVTTSGTLGATLNSQSANLIFASPNGSSGSPTFRSLVSADIPSLTYLIPSNNLSDVSSASTSRTNLGLGTSATHASTDYALVANNLSDLSSASAARTNLGLGTLATQSGTFSGTSSGTNTGDQTITLTGDVTGSGTGSFAATIASSAVTTAKINGNAVTYAKMQAISTTSLLLGSSSTTTAVQEIALGTNLSMSGTTLNATGGASFANPSASLGLTAINGSASTAMRSDAAPALDITIIPTWTGLHTFQKTALTNTSTDGLVIQNTTAATSSVPQWSPRLRIHGVSWDTAATASSKTIDYKIEAQTVTGQLASKSALLISSSVSGAAYTDILKLQADGKIFFPPISAGLLTYSTGTTNGLTSNTLASGSVLYGNGTSSVIGNSTTLTYGTGIGLFSIMSDAATTTVINAFTATHNSSGTAAAGYGTGILLNGKSSSTSDRNMASFNALWTTATDASRVAAITFQVANNTALVEMARLTAYGLTVGVIGAGTGKLNLTGVTSGVVTITPSATAGTQTYTIRDQGAAANFVLSNASGAAASAGQATLSSGTVTVSTTFVVAGSLIFLTDATTGSLTNIGTPTVGTITGGSSFVINSTNPLDTSKVNWHIVNP